MNLQEVFENFAADFELSVGDDDWSRLEKYFTDDVMKRIDDFCKEKFLYGTKSVDEEVVPDSTESTE